MFVKMGEMRLEIWYLASINILVATSFEENLQICINLYEITDL